MNEYYVLDKILDTIQYKYDRACCMYGFADEEDYIWILGAEIYRILASMSVLRYHSEDEGAKVYGIPCIIDRENQWRISLTREIK